MSAVEIKKQAEAEKQKGNDSMRSGEFKDALACYTKSIAICGDDPATYSNRALTYIKLKDFGKAKEDAEKALALKPNYIKAYHR